MNLRFVGYTRISTDKQTDSFETQKSALDAFVEEKGGILLNVYKETYSGKENHRPILEEAIAECRAINATLLVSKLDRLSRRIGFITNFVEKYNIEFIALDIPTEHAKNLIPILSLLSEMEREMISERTKEALQAKIRSGEYKPTGENLIGVKRNTGPSHQKMLENRKKHRYHVYNEMQWICKDYYKKNQKYPCYVEMVDFLNQRHNRTLQKKEWTKIDLMNFLAAARKTKEIEEFDIQFRTFKNQFYSSPSSTEEEEEKEKEESPPPPSTKEKEGTEEKFVPEPLPESIVKGKRKIARIIF